MLSVRTPIFAAALALSWLFTLAPSCPAATPGELLLRQIVERTHPEAAELRLDEEPDAEGNIRRLYLDIRGASLNGFRVDHVRIEPMMVHCNPPAAWGEDGAGLKVESAVDAHFDAVITEKDVNAFIAEKTFSSKNDSGEWRDVRFDVTPKGIAAKARYRASAGSLSTTILVELFSGLRVKDGNSLWLDRYTIRVNGDRKSESLVREAIEKAQPLADFREFLFPVRIKTLELSDETVRIATRVPPESFEGIVYKYPAP